MLKTTLIFVASLLTAGSILGGTASPAFAVAPAAPSRIVAFADLDLAHPAGRARLGARLAAAAGAVCGTAAPLDLNGQNRIRLCRAETLGAADLQLRRGEVLVVEVESSR